MSNILFRSFLLFIILFSIVVGFTMLNFTAGEEDLVIGGFSLNYFLIPLLASNLLILTFRFNQVRLKRITLIVFLWLLLIPLPILLEGQSFATNIVKVILWPTSYLAAYLFVKSKHNGDVTIHKTFVIVFFIGLYFFVQSKLAQTDLYSLGLMETSNTIFCALTILPWLLLTRNKKWLMIFFILLFIAVAFSNKRSATLILVVASLPFLNSIFGGIRSVAKRWILLGMSISFLGFGFVYISENYLEGKIFDRFESMQQDEGSGRLERWNGILNSLDNSSTGELLFGHGHFAVSIDDATGVGSSAAHNDFLDVIYDYGLFLFFLYLIFHVAIIRRMYFLYKQKSSLFNSYFSSWIIFVFMSVVSILMVQTRYLIYLAMYWGTIEAMIENRKYNCQMMKL